MCVGVCGSVCALVAIKVMGGSWVGLFYIY